MKTYIIRFAGTPPNHSDAPSPRLIEAESKEDAKALAHRLAMRDGLAVSSVRTYFQTHTALGGAHLWN